MTAVLLDTYALVWAIAAPEQLGDGARTRIEDPTCELLVSAVTAWEIATKVRLGRWPDAVALERQLLGAIDRLGATGVPIEVADALRAGRLAWEHRDPFDRMLAAQAIHRGVPLITRDQALSNLPGLTTIW